MSGPLLGKVIVNGETIAAEVIAAEAQNHPAPKGKPGVAWMAAARALAIRTLLLQEARRRGLTPDPQELAEGKIETDEEALVRQVLDEAVVPVTPDEAAMRALYDTDPDRWRAPTLYEAAHILLAVPPVDPAALERAEAEAAAIVEELRRDPQRFDALAREHSACSSRDEGGRLGQLTTGDTVPEFEAAMDRLTEGEIGAIPVQTRYGLHIVRLDARAPGAVLPFETVAPQIREMLEKAAWVRAAHAFVATLADAAEVSGITLHGAGVRAA